jgi:PST family polysaccharide transporter
MPNKIKLFLKRKDVTNGVWLYALQFFNLIVPLITLPYITRILGTSKYGTFSIAFNIVTYLQVVVEYGFGMSATRKVAINEQKNLDKLFTSVLFGRILLLLLSGVISLIYILLNRNNTELCISFIILLICLLGYCVQMNWIFQGMQEMKYISIVNVIGRIISTVLIFILVKSSNELFLYCLLYSISPLLSGFIGLFIAKRKYMLHLIRISFVDVIKEIRDGFYVFTTNISSKIFGSIGITFLGIFESAEIVGIFSAIQKITNIMLLLWLPISQVIYPISSKHFQNNFYEGKNFVLKVRKKFLPIFIAVAIAVGCSGKYVVGILFGNAYAKYYYWLYPLLVWLIISIDNNCWGIQTLLGSGHDREYGISFGIGVVCTIVINFVFIKTLGGNGAALAPMLSELILNIMLRYNVKSIQKIKQQADIH